VRVEISHNEEQIQGMTNLADMGYGDGPVRAFDKLLTKMSALSRRGS
jgi:hypothetical protein